jgi:peptidoglycan hydrolase CwlO-like protein
VKSEIDALNSKLNSTISILTSSIESTDQEYDLDELLERVVTNKVKLETFVNELDGAVGDGNSGVVSLMEQVAQNKADGAAEVSARGTAVSNLASTVSTNSSA